MLKYSLWIALCLFSTTFLAAQSSVMGRVVHARNETLPYASIQLKKSQDSSLVKVEYSSENGSYTFQNVPAVEYFISVSMVGFNSYDSPQFKVEKDKNTALPDIVLSESKTELKTVTVSARKALIEVKADKTVFNVEGSINATGNNVLELLQKSPGVMVDKDDNIILKGKSGVIIYIDGRQSQLQGADLNAVLKTMQSNEVEAIEIISQPSARFDAAGNAGIINIRLKKDKRLGTNGSVNMGYAQGIFGKWNSGLSLNHRNKGSNWFGNYAGRWAMEQSFINMFREQGEFRYEQRSVGRYQSDNNHFKVGADWFLNPKHTLGFVINGNLNNGENLSISRTPILALNTGTPQSILVANNISSSVRNNFNSNLNYRFADTTGHELNLDADFGRFSRDNNSLQPNTYYDAAEKSVLSSRTFQMITPAEISIYTFKADYSQKLGKGKLGLGIKTSLVHTDNTFNFYDVLDGAALFNNQRSNLFDYTENINAAYATYQQQWAKWSLNAGLRLENTNSRGELSSTQQNEDDLVKRQYTNLFPSAGLTHQVNNNNSLALNYSRRIDRPTYQTLNPFVSQLDELTYGKGNPFLRPQYTNNLELSHTYKYTLTTSLRFSRTTDFFGELSDTIEGNRNFIMTSNLATENVISLNVSYPFNVAKWWSVYANVNAYRSVYEANFGEGRFLSLKATVLSLYAQQTFTLPKGWRIETSGFYNSPSIWRGTYANRRFWGMDLGLQKRLWKEKATLKLTFSDVFHSMQWRGISRFSGLTIDASGGWESQQFRLNLNYNFGSQQIKAARRRSTGLEEESNRVN